MQALRGRIRGLSFDYGHVLAGLDLDELAARLGATARRAAIERALPAAYRAHDEAIAAGHGHEGAWRALMAVLVDAAGANDRPRDAWVDELWRAQPTRNLWRFVPPSARTLLEELRSLGVPMVVTSNSEGRIAELLRDVGIAQYFRASLDSGLLGFAKPDRRIFERAAASLEIPLEAMLHIGDSEAADVVGAKDAGAYAVRFDGFVPFASARPTIADARASTHEELTAILRDAIAR